MLRASVMSDYVVLSGDEPEIPGASTRTESPGTTRSSDPEGYLESCRESIESIRSVLQRNL
jgi:hypothetical protein